MSFSGPCTQVQGRELCPQGHGPPIIRCRTVMRHRQRSVINIVSVRQPPQPPPPQPQPQPQPPHSAATLAQSVTGVPGWRSWSFRYRGTVFHLCQRLFHLSCDPSMLSLMSSPNSSHVVGAVPVFMVFLVVFVSFLFGSLTACTMFGTSKVPFPSRRVGAAPLMGGSGESSVVVPNGARIVLV